MSATIEKNAQNITQGEERRPQFSDNVWSGRVKRTLTLLSVFFLLYYLWGVFTGALSFQVGAYDFGMEKLSHVFWSLVTVVLLRLVAGHRSQVSYLRAQGIHRIQRCLNLLLAIAAINYLIIALFHGPTLRFWGIELGIQKIETAFWILFILVFLRLAAGIRQLASLIRSPRFWLLVLILVVAAVARLHEIDFGLPLKEHPDEPEIVAKPLRMLREGLNPRYFVYPSLYFYSLCVVYETCFNWQELTDLLLPTLPTGHEEIFTIYLLGRMTTAAFGLLTVLLLFPVGKRLYGRASTGLFAALFLALFTTHIHNSMYITTDVPVAFFALLSFYLAVRAHDSGLFAPWALLSALVAGLTASTKYNGASVLVAPALVVFFFFLDEIRSKTKDGGWIASLFRLIWRGLAMTLVFLAGFIIGTPYSVLDFDTFWGAVVWDYSHYAGGHAGAMGSGNFWFYLSYLAHDGMGYGLFALGILGVVLMILSRRRKDLLYLVFTLVYFIEISVFTVRFNRNLCPIVPLLALYAAVAIDYIVCRLRGGEVPSPARRRLSWIVPAIICVLVLWYPVSNRISEELKSGLPHSKVMATEWFEANIPPGATVAFELYTPHINWDQYVPQYIRFLHRKPMSWYRDRHVEYFIFNSYAYRRFYKYPKEFAEEIAGYEALFNHPDMNHLVSFNVNEKQYGPIIKIYQLRPAETEEK